MISYKLELFLAFGTITAALAGIYYVIGSAPKRECALYAEETGRVTKYTSIGCFVRVGDVWVHRSELHTLVAD